MTDYLENVLLPEMHKRFEEAELLSTHDQPTEEPWRLALATVFQFMKHLTDRQAADAVRSRLAWKYALSLDLTDPGFVLLAPARVALNLGQT